jgi:hypothetical protein
MQSKRGKCKATQVKSRQSQDAKTPRHKTKQGQKQGKPTAISVLCGVLSPSVALCLLKSKTKSKSKNRSKSKKSKRKSKGKEEAHLDFRLVWALLPWRSVCFSFK